VNDCVALADIIGRDEHRPLGARDVRSRAEKLPAPAQFTCHRTFGRRDNQRARHSVLLTNDRLDIVVNNAGICRGPAPIAAPHSGRR
jgi:NAD(P)-dependent dehydrogenase (short-subunit alcohol dehydrogenase family)